MKSEVHESARANLVFQMVSEKCLTAKKSAASASHHKTTTTAVTPWMCHCCWIIYATDLWQWLLKSCLHFPLWKNFCSPPLGLSPWVTIPNSAVLNLALWLDSWTYLFFPFKEFQQLWTVNSEIPKNHKSYFQ